MKNERNYRGSAIMAYIASVLFLVAAILGYINGQDFMVIDFCVACLMMALGTINLIKYLKEKKSGK